MFPGNSLMNLMPAFSAAILSVGVLHPGA